MPNAARARQGLRDRGDRLSQYLTIAEIVMLYGRPEGTIRRLASTDQWRRSQDRRKPVLYSTIDIETTMERLAEQTT